jgi:FkbM family methyltransferase
MINFYDVNDPSRKLHPDSWLGKLLRLPLRVIPKNAVLPILQGPGRGLKWIVGSYNHGCWLGSYEFEKQTVLHEILRPGDVVYDIGAHVGYFAIIFGKLVGAAGAVYAFEPMRENYDFLLQHIAINNLSNVTAVCAGIAVSSGTACFMALHHHAMSHRTDSGPVRVPVYNLEEYVRDNHLPAPNLIKMDIEGEELFVLPSILEFVVRHRTKLLLSTHDNGSSGVLGKLLSSRGYSVRPLQWASHPAERNVASATLLFASLGERR